MLLENGEITESFDGIIIANGTQSKLRSALRIPQTCKARRRHLRFYQTASRWLTPLFQSDSRFAAMLRDWSFPLANRLPYTRREAARTVAGLKTGFLFDKPVVELEGERAAMTIDSRALGKATSK